MQTPCYKQHKLCKERSQGNIQFDCYCSLKLQDTPHLTRPNEIKNSTFKYKMGAPLLALCNNRVHNVPLLTPYRSARLVINHKTLPWHKIIIITYVCKSFACNPDAMFRPLHTLSTFNVATRHLDLCCAIYCTVCVQETVDMQRNITGIEYTSAKLVRQNLWIRDHSKDRTSGVYPRIFLSSFFIS